MPGYRAYLVGPDDHILQCVELVCANDEAAKERAKTLADGYDIELWQEAGKIAVILSATGPAPDIRVNVPPEQ